MTDSPRPTTALAAQEVVPLPLPATASVEAPVADRFRLARMLRFAGVGAVGTVLNIAVMAVLLAVGVHYLPAAIVATEVTILTNFLLQERVVIADLKQGSRRRRHRLVASFGFNNLETLVRIPFVVLLVESLAFPSLLAQTVTLGLAFLLRFTFIHRVVYRQLDVDPVEPDLVIDLVDRSVPVAGGGLTEAEVNLRLQDMQRDFDGEPLVVVLVPAHDEQDGIVKTVRSIYAQSTAPQLVIVMADNCTDATVPLAQAAGALVIETVGNTAKKAGALNQGLRMVMPFLSDDDYVVCQDADGELAPDFLEQALRTFDMVDDLGGLSGAVVARKATNVVESSQAIEYARGMRLMSRAGGRVHVLSGAATVFPVHVLRAVAAGRGTLLPGERGSYFMEDSLTEDYELTLAIKKLGYTCSSTKRCTVVTDVMPTLHDLHVQRLRWFRGAMESMWLYGWSRLTHKTWIGIGWTFFVSLLFPLSVVVLFASWLIWGTLPDLRYALLFPLFAAEGVVTARRIDRRARLLAVLFVPLWIYDNVMFAFYWQALFQALRQKTRVWVT